MPSPWPLHDLRLTTTHLELRGLTEAWALRLADLVPDDLEADPRLAHASPAADVLQAYWRNLGLWQPASWVLPLVVLHDGEPVGLQALEADDLAGRGVVDTHSWLVPAARGRGLGKQMRCAVLELAFRGLGARWAITEAWTDNTASLGVSRSLGYVDNGVDVHPGGRVMQRLLLDARTWSPPWPVALEGLDPCLALLGVR